MIRLLSLLCLLMLVGCYPPKEQTSVLSKSCSYHPEHCDLPAYIPDSSIGKDGPPVGYFGCSSTDGTAGWCKSEIANTTGTLTISGIGASSGATIFPVCNKRGESHFASNSTFRILCWSESKQIFTEPYVLLEQ